jgi:phosphatidylglycerol:prolipoprotein diacylglycerol transferase
VLLQRERKRSADPVPDEQRWSLVLASIAGALVGAKLVHWTNEIPHVLAHAGRIETWVGGKSMVGALIGGVLAVEIVKQRLGITRRTGDVYVFPLIASMALGRLGCFAAGLADHTYGSATTLPWGVDFGDGIARHPTQLYEFAFLLALGVWIARSRVLGREGARFDAFFFAYLGARFALDFLKPYPRFGGLCGTQIWCLAGVAARIVWSARRSPREVLS